MTDNENGLHVHNEEAEKIVLGGVLSGKDVDGTALRRLRPEDFYVPAHQTIYATWMGLEASGKPCDGRAVLAQLVADNTIHQVSSGSTYILELMKNAPAAALSHYVGLVKDASTRRSIAILTAKTNQMTGNPTDTTLSILDKLKHDLDSLSESTSNSNIPSLDLILPRMLQSVAEVQSGEVSPGLSTGFTDLDSKLTGLQEGQMIVIAARPGMGKSTLGLDIARHVAFKQDKSVLIFSLEMADAELLKRALSAEARVPSRDFSVQGGLDDLKWERVNTAIQMMENKKLGIDDDPAITLNQARAKARVWQRKYGLDLIVFDYLQLMNSDTRYDSRQMEVSEISRGLKLLAKEFKIPVIAISQLNRGPEQRTDKKPQMSDLRESGSIEQDADVVILLHREEAYDKNTPRAGEADVIIAKQRAGPTGTVVLAWLGAYPHLGNRAM